jgi:hypothetical protein
MSLTSIHLSLNYCLNLSSAEDVVKAASCGVTRRTSPGGRPLCAAPPKDGSLFSGFWVAGAMIYE